MWFWAVTIWQYLLCNSASEVPPQLSFITLRDKSFVGVDQTLSDQLSRRTNSVLTLNPEMSAQEESLLDFPELKDLFDDANTTKNIATPVNIAEEALFNFSNSTRNLSHSNFGKFESRRLFHTIHHYYTISEKALEMMKQPIYSVRKRFQDFEPIIKKYEKDERTRLAIMLEQLIAWREEMRMTLRHLPHPYRGLGRWGNDQYGRENCPETDNIHVYKYMVGYARMLKRNIDITYTVEFARNCFNSYKLMFLKVRLNTSSYG